ncbi:MAG: AAA family ATPase [Deltaproteobacteria bacterium]|nr:AAA family ATPase [Deltaproteobacteria bacterium]MBW2360767.1 AAA family ATPase [Deltaproteobacteria bacterium]
MGGTPISEPVRHDPARAPVLVAMSGQVASGKSSVARGLAEHLGALCVEGDGLRSELVPQPHTAVHEADWWRIFERGFEERIYAEFMRRARQALSTGRPVVLDACFPRNAQRLHARALAREVGAAFLLVECVASDETVRARLAARDSGPGRGGWRAIHGSLAARYEPCISLAPDEHMQVSTDGRVEQAVARVLTAPCLRERLRRGAAAPPRPRAVTFDCWNTLLCEEDWETAHALRVEELQLAARSAGRNVSQRDARRAFDAAWERHMRLWAAGEASGAREVALSGLAELGLRAPHPALEDLIVMFEEASHSSRVRALDGARAVLDGLADAGIPCALICDTGLTPGRVVRRHLDAHHLLQGLAVQVFSDELGVPKPDARTFRAALEPLGVPPEHALHVGDLRRTDVAGARALGMTTVRIRARHDDASDLADADHLVESHAELAELLGLAAPVVA